MKRLILVLFVVTLSFSQSSNFNSSELLILNELKESVNDMQVEVRSQVEGYHNLRSSGSNYRIKNIAWGGLGSLTFLGSVAMKASIANPPGDVNSKEPLEGEEGLRATSIVFDVMTISSIAMIVRNKIKSKREYSKADGKLEERNNLRNQKFSEIFTDGINHASASNNVFFKDSIYKIISIPELLTSEHTSRLSSLSRSIEESVSATTQKFDQETAWEQYKQYGLSFKRILRVEQDFLRKYGQKFVSQEGVGQGRIDYKIKELNLPSDSKKSFEINNPYFSDLKISERTLHCAFDSLLFIRTDDSVHIVLDNALKYRYYASNPSANGSITFLDTDKYLPTEKAEIVETLTLMGVASKNEMSTPEIVSKNWFAKIHITYEPTHFLSTIHLHSKMVSYEIEYNKNLKLGYKE